MSTDFLKTVASCFAAFWQLCSIQRSVSRPVLLSFVTSLVLSRLDYECATLAGIPKYLLDRLQSVLSAAARLIAVLTSITTCLHCLRNYTGCLFLDASNTVWPYLCFIVGTTWHRCQVLPTMKHVPGERPPVGC